MTLFGTKDETGKALTIFQTQIDAPDLNPEKAGRIFYDPAGNPTRTILDGGGSVSWEYASPTRVIVTLTSADGATQAQFPYDQSQSAIRSRVRQSRALAGRGDTRVAPVQPRAAALQSMQPGRTITIRTTCGGEPVAASLKGSYSVGEPTLGTPLAFQQTAPGVFVTTLPTAPAPQINAGPMCEFLGDLAGVACTAANAIGVPGVTHTCIAAALLPATAPLVPICEAVGLLLVGACKFVPEDAGVIIPCDAIQNVVDFFTTDTVRVFLTATNPSLGSKSDILVSDGVSQIPDQTDLELPSTPSISLLATDPFDPAPTQGYNIIGVAQCAPDGTEFRLSITGTDGYQDSSTTILTADNKTALLAVPGAEGGIVDTITGELGTDTRTVFITF